MVLRHNATPLANEIWDEKRVETGLTLQAGEHAIGRVQFEREALNERLDTVTASFSLLICHCLIVSLVAGLVSLESQLAGERSSSEKKKNKVWKKVKRFDWIFP